MFPFPFENMRASTASHAENKCSTYTRYASALFSAVSLYLLRLFSKGLVFPLPIVSGKTSDIVCLFNKHLSLADCCILFTITSKKTKCRSAFCSAKRAIKPVQGCTGLIIASKTALVLHARQKDFCFNRCPGERIIKL